MSNSSIVVGKKSIIIGIVAVAIIAVIALVQYKNSKIESEIIAFLDDSNANASKLGASLEYSSVKCNGLISTDCSVKNLELGTLFFEKMSIDEININGVEKLEGFKKISSNESSNAAFDLEIKNLYVPDSLLSMMLNDMSEDYAQDSLLSIFQNVDIALKGDVDGDGAYFKTLNIDKFRMNNNLMPFEFSMKARELDVAEPMGMLLDSMVVETEYKDMDFLSRIISGVYDDVSNDELKTLALESIEQDLISGEQSHMEHKFLVALKDLLSGKGSKISLKIAAKGSDVKFYELESSDDVEDRFNISIEVK